MFSIFFLLDISTWWILMKIYIDICVCIIRLKNRDKNVDKISSFNANSKRHFTKWNLHIYIFSCACAMCMCGVNITFHVVAMYFVLHFVDLFLITELFLFIQRTVFVWILIFYRCDIETIDFFLFRICFNIFFVVCVIDVRSLKIDRWSWHTISEALFICRIVQKQNGSIIICNSE